MYIKEGVQIQILTLNEIQFTIKYVLSQNGISQIIDKSFRSVYS